MMRLRFVDAGEIVTAHGIKGDIKVLPWTDGPEFLQKFRRVRVGEQDFAVERCRIQKTCNLLKLCGIDTMDAAQSLRGKTVQIYREDAPEGVIFAEEMIGMEVYTETEKLGEIKEVLDYPGNKVYVVCGEYEYMIPAVKQFVLSVSLEENQMKVHLLEGMRSDED